MHQMETLFSINLPLIYNLLKLVIKMAYAEPRTFCLISFMNFPKLVTKIPSIFSLGVINYVHKHSPSQGVCQTTFVQNLH